MRSENLLELQLFSKIEIKMMSIVFFDGIRPRWSTQKSSDIVKFLHNMQLFTLYPMASKENRRALWNRTKLLCSKNIIFGIRIKNGVDWCISLSYPSALIFLQFLLWKIIEIFTKNWKWTKTFEIHISRLHFIS
jgi:hypothetical protein